ncbi:MAG: hypothetical protein ABH832_03610 [bacterium]
MKYFITYMHCQRTRQVDHQDEGEAPKNSSTGICSKCRYCSTNLYGDKTQEYFDEEQIRNKIEKHLKEESPWIGDFPNDTQKYDPELVARFDEIERVAMQKIESERDGESGRETSKK